MSSSKPGKRKRLREPDSNTVALLEQAWVVLAERIVESVADAGHPIRAAHSAVLVYVDGKGIRLTKLADRAQMTPQAMSELVDDLVKDGYLQRVPDPTDRRAKLIVLTDAGTGALQSTFDAIAEVEKSLEKLLGRDQVAEFRSILRKITE